MKRTTACTAGNLREMVLFLSADEMKILETLGLLHEHKYDGINN